MIAILSALPDETYTLRQRILSPEEGGSGETRYAIGSFHDREVLLGSTGVGIRRARAGAEFIIDRYKPGLIISAGLSGGLCPSLSVGDIVLGESVISLRKGESLKLYSPDPGPGVPHRTGAILTENRFVNDPRLKSGLFGESGALAVDMETWGVAEAAVRSETPVMSVRSVSDAAHERLPDLGVIYGASGRLVIRKALPYFVLRPSLFPPYIRFRYRSYKKAARSLGPFLESLLRHMYDTHEGL